MQCYNFENGVMQPYGQIYPGSAVLPENHIVLQRTPIHSPDINNAFWQPFYEACRTLSGQIAAPQYVFVDGSWDPIHVDNTAVVDFLNNLRQIWPQSRVCLLSAKAQHYYDAIPGCVYFPLFAMIRYQDLHHRPKAGRIGCLNRRNAAHRVWLMHHLLDQQLIDPERDVYSVAFTSLWSGHYMDVDNRVGGITWFNEAQRRWPTLIQTHPDDFPNDYGTSHPAWHTGIVIITETEVDQKTLICEKTAKGILSKSCFSIYMHEVGYRVLEDMGFAPRFFEHHAQEWNIEPIEKICRDFASADDAIAYSYDHQQQIDHNFHWFGDPEGPINTRPWFARWQPKLQQALDCL